MGKEWPITGFALAMVMALALAGPLAKAADPAPPAHPGRQLASAPPIGRWISAVGCITSAMRYHKINVSDAVVYGGTGFAFGLNIHDKVDISGPTAWDYKPMYKLAANLGLNIDYISATPGADRDKDREMAWEKIATAIDQGNVAFGWAMDVPEFYLIFGYDDQGNYLFRDFGGQSKKLARAKLCKDWDLNAGAMAKGTPADETTMARAALQFALDVAAGKYANGSYHAGPAGYDAWIKALTDGTADPAGNAYNSQCWAEARQAASEFLREAARRTTDNTDLKTLYEDAAQSYGTVGVELKAVADLFPFSAGNAAMMKQHNADAQRCKQAAKHLEAARDAESQGLAILEQILAK